VRRGEDDDGRGIFGLFEQQSSEYFIAVKYPSTRAPSREL